MDYYLNTFSFSYPSNNDVSESKSTTTLGGSTESGASDLDEYSSDQESFMDSIGPKYYIDIFHDSENCSVPANAKATDVVRNTLTKVLTAFLGDELEDDIDFEQEVAMRWFFIAQSNSVHVSPAFINDLRTSYFDTNES